MYFLMADKQPDASGKKKKKKKGPSQLQNKPTFGAQLIYFYAYLLATGRIRGYARRMHR